MHWLGLLLAMLAAPFWESKAPADWSDIELAQLLTDSPWAQLVGAPGRDSGPAVQVYLATAAPMALAERERDLRLKRKRPPKETAAEDPLAEEYRAWLEDNHDSQIVVAIRTGNNPAFSNEQETRRMEEDSVMRSGKKKFKITGHFPPSASDPYLRLAFPRQVDPREKTITFELYLPGVGIPFREVEFRVKDMLVRGKLEL